MTVEQLKKLTSDLGVNTSVQLANQSVADLFDTLGSRGFDPMKARTKPSGMPVLKYGGTLKVNAEGKEVMQSPNSNTGVEIKGPSHNQGGVNLDLPDGVSIFSDKLKYESKTFAERKAMRDKKLKKTNDRFRNSDGISRFTKERMEKNNKFLDNTDLFLQDLLSQKKGFKDGKRIKAEYGMKAENGLNPLPQREIGDLPFRFREDKALIDAQNYDMTSAFNVKKSNPLIPMTQDERGYLAQQLTSLAPAAMTLANRAGDTPNINAYANVGNDALQRMERSKLSQASMGENMINELSGQFATTRASLNRGSSSINQARNLTMAADASQSRAYNQTQGQIATQLGAVDDRIAATSMNIDKIRADGEQARDLANRQDRDVFFTNFGQNLVTAGEGQMKGARDLNSKDYQKEVRELIQNWKNNRISYEELNSQLNLIYSNANISFGQKTEKSK